jgi:hypothetical protein
MSNSASRNVPSRILKPTLLQSPNVSRFRFYRCVIDVPMVFTGGGGYSDILYNTGDVVLESARGTHSSVWNSRLFYGTPCKLQVRYRDRSSADSLHQPLEYIKWLSCWSQRSLTTERDTYVRFIHRLCARRLLKSWLQTRQLQPSPTCGTCGTGTVRAVPYALPNTVTTRGTTLRNHTRTTIHCTAMPNSK